MYKRQHPYSVVLFDEVEKAHPDVFNVLLQVLDDGRITDSQGRTVDFKNTIIIMTSNLGSDIILDGIGADGEISQEARDTVSKLLARSFRPEFLNRIDEIVFYKPLTKENIKGLSLIHIFTIKGTIILQKGFLRFDDSERKDKLLPPLEKGDKVNICFKPMEKQTSPPKHYTIETLNN